MPRTFEIRTKTTKYANNWMTVQEYEIYRDGQAGIYGVVERPDSVSIVASTSDGRVLFVKQYRFPTESYSWELPMGGVDRGEEPMESARRELLEETGLESPLSEIGSFHPIPGLTPQRATAFRASILDDAISQVESFDATVDEITDRRLLNREEIKQMIKDGEISDGFTLCTLALCHYLT